MRGTRLEHGTALLTSPAIRRQRDGGLSGQLGALREGNWGGRGLMDGEFQGQDSLCLWKDRM